MAQRPDLTVSAVRPAAEPGDTTRVLFDDPSLAEYQRLAVFIDPVTGESTGELASYGSSASLPLRTWISGLHRNLNLGEPGRMYSELAASWMWVIALGGLAMWIARWRRTRRTTPARARLATIDRSTSGRRRTLNWHGAMGVWIVVGLVFLSATGLTWSRYAGENIGDLRAALSWTTPELSTDLGGAEAGAASNGHAGHGGSTPTTGPDTSGTSGVDATVTQLDDVLQVARSAGVDGAVEISIPADASTAVTVAQTRDAWQFSPNSIAVDGATGHVVDTSWFADWPLDAKLTNWGIALHMGILFGLVSQLALLALAVILVAIIVRGYQMWWQRRPARGARPVGRAPSRGGWRKAPAPWLIIGVIVTAIIGWYVPLLGIPLLAFLVVDGVIGAVRTVSQRRAQR